MATALTIPAMVPVSAMVSKTKENNLGKNNQKLLGFLGIDLDIYIYNIYHIIHLKRRFNV